MVEGVALSSAVSVISSFSRPASRPASVSASSTASTKPGCWISRAETLTHRKTARRSRPPAGGLAAGLAQDPAADGQDGAVLLRQLDELAGRDEPALGMLPANERLDAGQTSRVEAHDGLVDDAQLLQLDSSLELRAELVALADDGVHARIEDGEAGLAVGLGQIHRDVGVADDIGRVLAGVAGAGDADAGGDRDVVVADQVRRAELAGQPLGHGARAAQVGGVLGQDGELVAAQAGDQVALAHRVRDALGDRDQERITSRMAEGVVDDLEVVEVDEQDRADLGSRA